MSRLHLRQIDVTHLYGCRFGLSLTHLSPRITVIYGPNAAGKTTLAKGISLFLNPERADKSDMIIGQFQLDESRSDFKIFGKTSTPDRPQSARPYLYQLTIHEIIDGPNQDDQATLANSLAGGLRLERQNSSGYPVRAPVQALHKLSDHLKDLKSRAQALKSGETELEANRNKLRESLLAEESLRLLSDWKTSWDYRREEQSFRGQIARLDEANPGLEKQNHDAGREITSLSKALEGSLETVRLAEAGLSEFGNREAAGSLLATDKESLQSLAEVARSAQGALAQARHSLGQAVDRKVQAELDLQNVRPDKSLFPLDFGPSHWQGLEASLANYKKAEEKVRECETNIQRLTADFRRALRSLAAASGLPGSISSGPGLGADQPGLEVTPATESILNPLPAPGGGQGGGQSENEKVHISPETAVGPNNSGPTTKETDPNPPNLQPPITTESRQNPLPAPGGGQGGGQSESEKVLRNEALEEITVPSESLIREWIELDHQLNQSQIRWEDAQRTVKQAESDLTEIHSVLSNRPTSSRQILQELVADPGISYLADQDRIAQNRKEALESLVRQWDQEYRERFGQAEGIDAAAAGLRAWLRAIPESSSPEEGLSLPLIAGIAFVIVAVILGLAVNPSAGLWVAVVGLVVVLGLSRMKPISKTPVDNRAEAAKGIPAEWNPVTWTVNEVADQLAKVTTRSAEIQVYREILKSLTQRAEEALDAQASRQLKDRLEAFSTSTGIREINPYELADLLNRLLRLAEAEENLAKAKARLAEAQSELDNLNLKRQDLIATSGSPVHTGAETKSWADALVEAKSAQVEWLTAKASLEEAQNKHRALTEDVKTFLMQGSWPPDGSLVSAVERFKNWSEVSHRCRQETRAVHAETERVRELEQTLQRHEQTISEILGRYDFGSHNAVLDQVNPFLRWFEATEAVRGARRQVNDREAALKQRLDELGIPEAETLANRIRLCQLREELAEKRSDLVKEADKRSNLAIDYSLRPGVAGLGEKYGLREEVSEFEFEQVLVPIQDLARLTDRLRTTIANTERDLEMFGNGSDIAKAEAEKALEIARLSRWMDNKKEELAMGRVVEKITNAVRVEAQPQIIRRANDWLGRLTGGRYHDLDLRDKEVFVRDGREGDIPKPVGKLSTGIRTHLALAVRLAVIEVSETSGVKFPLVLDEVMATSDPDASQAIAEAIRTISEDRQVIVLTNQLSDIELLRDFVESPEFIVALGNAPMPAFTPTTQQPASQEQLVPGFPMSSSLYQWPPALIQSVVPALSTSEKTVYVALERLSDTERVTSKALVDALESVRALLAPAYRRLEWTNIVGESWVTKAFESEIRDLLLKTNGAAKPFVEGMTNLKGYRKANQAELTQWLEKNGYTNDLPSSEQLFEAAYQPLPEALPNRFAVARGLVSFLTLPTPT